MAGVVVGWGVEVGAGGDVRVGKYVALPPIRSFKAVRAKWYDTAYFIG